VVVLAWCTLMMRSTGVRHLQAYGSGARTSVPVLCYVLLDRCGQEERAQNDGGFHSSWKGMKEDKSSRLKAKVALHRAAQQVRLRYAAN